ncbi:NmrA family NAD(P)-binding protein [Haloprofundus marisrubri]|uniref:NmrA family NAD(P)-binding protein n=1 Tax=Haloprofundus marisrubri TaxID=1514971 RepID=UPI0008F90327|nr:NmrA family NAD(P)-binding protein [Haloprofundus marisrubri]
MGDRNDPNNTVLVTGATGTVGTTLTELLAEYGRSVRIATRTPASAAADEPESVRFDFEKPETWGRAFEGVDRLFLLLPPGGDVARARDAVDAAIRVGVDHVVFLSVLGANRNPLLPHRRIERHLEQSDASYTFLRASFFMQNLAEVHAVDVREHDELFVPAGEGRTSFVDARDVAAVAAAALTEPGHENQRYDLTGREALTYDEAAQVFSETLGRRITYPNPSPFRFARRTYGRDEPLGFVVVMLGIYTVARLGFSGRVTDDVERVLGRSPTSLAEFVDDYREVWDSSVSSASSPESAPGTGLGAETDVGANTDSDSDSDTDTNTR